MTLYLICSSVLLHITYYTSVQIIPGNGNVNGKDEYHFRPNYRDCYFPYTDEPAANAKASYEETCYYSWKGV